MSLSPTDSKKRESGVFRNKRKLMRKRPGQALPLAGLGFLIMFLAVLATMNLGQAVYQKMRTQNAADSAAYSLAAMEARAFNFVALTNRTQIVHYNTALVLQSYLSYAGFVVGMSNTVRDMLKVAKAVNDIGCKLPPPANVPFCAGARIIDVVVNIVDIFAEIARNLYSALHTIVGYAVDAISRFNRYAIWQMQLIRLLLINAHLLTGMHEFIQANDDEMGFTSKNKWFNVLLNGVLNSLEFRKAFDSGAGLNPFLLDLVLDLAGGNLNEYGMDPSDEDIQEAQGVMAEMINASRNQKGIYDRSATVIAVGIGVIAGEKKGQTKVVDEGEVGPEVGRIRKSPKNYPAGADTLASDDYLASGFGFMGLPGTAVLVRGTNLGDGIYADEEGGEHYRYRESGKSAGGPGGLGGVMPIPFPTTVDDTFETKSGNKSDHKFFMAPYFKFKPNPDRESEYGQPSTWIFLNKHHENFQTGSNKKPWQYKFNFQHGSWPTASLDTTIGGKRNSYLLEGLNVIARGQVYYHRPGVWDEHPNFFNPFWRARLAPVGAALQNLFDRLVSNNISTESENQIIQWVVNFLRNSVADFFFRMVTAVMTH